VDEAMPRNEDDPMKLDEPTETLLEATRLAWLWHGDQTRKGKSTCYVGHLLQVAGLVIEHGGESDQIVAALLHDSLEDAESPDERHKRESQILARFGEAPLAIILDCTDTTSAEAGARKGPWQERKNRYIDQLERAAPRSLLVAACDKRHNLGDLVGDLHLEGLPTFDRFSAGAPEQLWYFESLGAIFRKPKSRIPARLLREYEGLLSELQRLCASAT
jgi:GTP pyrophosphokinase